MVQLQEVVKTFGAPAAERPVLSGVSLSLEAGSFTAVQGRSGSGKSTLLNLIAGLDRPDAGSIIIDGVDVTRLPVEELARFRLSHIGVVFQFFNLLPTLTLEQNVALPGHLAALPKASIRSRTAECLQAVGLEGARARRPHEVSGGEIQRAAVARALFNKPRLVLADEPTGNLDAENAERVFTLFVRLVREQAATLLLVTHDAALTAGADRSFRLQDGRLL